MSTTRPNSFKPTVEGLEERSLMNGAPVSPLSGYALTMLKGSINNYQALAQLPGLVANGAGQASGVPACVGYFLNAERNLQNTIRVLEQVESVYEEFGFDGGLFQIYDYYFHVIDQAVMNQAVADMQWYYAVCQGSNPGCGTNM
jgi:hypothetical protein